MAPKKVTEVLNRGRTVRQLADVGDKLGHAGPSCGRVALANDSLRAAPHPYSQVTPHGATSRTPRSDPYWDRLTDTDTTEATADTEATDDAARTRADDGATTAADTATEVGPTDTDPSAGDGEDDDAEDHDDLTVADGPHADDGATVTEQVEELVVSDPTNTEELDDDGDDAFDQAGECDRCGMALDADAVADGPGFRVIRLGWSHVCGV